MAFVKNNFKIVFELFCKSNYFLTSGKFLANFSARLHRFSNCCPGVKNLPRAIGTEQGHLCLLANTRLLFLLRLQPSLAFLVFRSLPANILGCRLKTLLVPENRQHMDTPFPKVFSFSVSDRKTGPSKLMSSLN